MSVFRIKIKCVIEALAMGEWSLFTVKNPNFEDLCTSHGKEIVTLAIEGSVEGVTMFSCILSFFPYSICT